MRWRPLLTTCRRLPRIKDINDKLEEYSRTLEQKVDERTAKLKAAQAQLVQSEKMASLGQLTAGMLMKLKIR